MVIDRYRHICFFPVVRPDHRAAPGGGRRPVVVANRPGARSVAVQPADAEGAAFSAWVLRQSGLDPSLYRSAPLIRRIPACLRALRVNNLDEAGSLLERRPERMAAALGALVIGATDFFRDPSVFDQLQVWLAARETGRRPPRVWSAGCSEGAELYSVAMILSRLAMLDGSILLGTDCRADAVERARAGWFRQAHWKGLSAVWKAEFFRPDADGFRICETLRRKTEWCVGNLLEETAHDPRPWDVILCRNVAIYLEAAASAALWKRLVDRLDEGGILVTGKAERPGCEQRVRRIAPSIFLKTDGRTE